MSVCLVLSVSAAYAHITHYVVRVWAHTYMHAQYLCNFDASAAVCCTKNISAPTYKRHCQLVRLCSYMQQKSNGLPNSIFGNSNKTNALQSLNGVKEFQLYTNFTAEPEKIQKKRLKPFGLLHAAIRKGEVHSSNQSDV